MIEILERVATFRNNSIGHIVNEHAVFVAEVFHVVKYNGTVLWYLKGEGEALIVNKRR